jgi:Hypoxanthine-guanine phosphoribosyltransferase
VVIDDVLDEGHTLAAVRRALTEFAPARLAAAVLVEKAVARDADAAHAEYVGLHLPNRYLFGCGMDYHEHWRHLPEIYAVREPL